MWPSPPRVAWVTLPAEGLLQPGNRAPYSPDERQRRPPGSPSVTDTYQLEKECNAWFRL